MIKEIGEGVIQFAGMSNVYVLPDEKIVIDTGERGDYEELKKAVSDYVKPEDIKKVIFTHLHYDHTGNVDLFSNATIYASEKAIESFEKDPFGTVLNKNAVELLQDVKLNPVEDMEGLQIIEVPGHTKGSIAILSEDKGLLFTGDTLFERGVGRTDLPSSSPQEMKESLQLLNKYSQKICPGHDY